MTRECYERHWGDEPPINLHFQAVLSGRLIEPWNVPIVVDDASEAPARVRVSRQGEKGTTPKERPTGESGRLAPGGSTTVIEFKGEPMAGDPVSQSLRSTEPRHDPGL